MTNTASKIREAMEFMGQHFEGSFGSLKLKEEQVLTNVSLSNQTAQALQSAMGIDIGSNENTTNKGFAKIRSTNGPGF